MNYTRIFTGSYVEPRGALGIQRNTLAPMKGRFLAPWARSAKRGYAGRGRPLHAAEQPVLFDFDPRDFLLRFF
jgi:hypothetical protein